MDHHPRPDIFYPTHFITIDNDVVFSRALWNSWQNVQQLSIHSSCTTLSQERHRLGNNYIKKNYKNNLFWYSQHLNFFHNHLLSAQVSALYIKLCCGLNSFFHFHVHFILIWSKGKQKSDWFKKTLIFIEWLVMEFLFVQLTIFLPSCQEKPLITLASSCYLGFQKW